MVLLRRPQACGHTVIRRRLATLFAALLSAAGPAAAASPKVEAFWRSCQHRLTKVPEDGFYRVRRFSTDAKRARRMLDLIRDGEKTVTFFTSTPVTPPASAAVDKANKAQERNSTAACARVM